MFGQNPSTISWHVDEQSPSVSDCHHLESFDLQDQQTFAASNALCALRHYQPSLMIEPTFSSRENEGGLQALQTPSSTNQCQDASWITRTPWVEPYFTSEAPVQGIPWTFTTIDHLANGNCRMQYPTSTNYASQEYNVPSVNSFPAMGQTPTPPMIQPPTPPSENVYRIPYPYVAFSSSGGLAPGSAADIESEEIAHPPMDSSVTARNRANDVPYAKLIESALLEAEENKLVLKDIYRWIEQNTDKANNPKCKGWQNSVRHNLSMNGAFTKIALPATSEKPQKGSMWQLEPSAKKHGIQSTTRYRRKDETKRLDRRFEVDVHRERHEKRRGYASQKPAKGDRSLKTRQGPLSLNYMQSRQSLHDRCHRSISNQRRPAPSHPFLASRTQAYLPSPPLRSSSPHQMYSGLKADHDSVTLRSSSPLAYTDL